MSGHRFMKGDGILGLGVEYDEQNSADTDETSDNDDPDEEPEDEEEEEAATDDTKKESGGSGSSKKSGDAPKKMQLENFELNTGIVSNHIRSINRISAQMFSLFISDTVNSIPQKLIIGNYSTEYIHDPSANQIQWVQLSTEQSDYYVWQVDIDQLSVVKKKDGKIINQEIISSFKQDAIISLSTTAIILPKDELSQLVAVLNDVYHINCKVQSKYMYFVVCTDMLYNDFVFNDIEISIQLDDSTLYIDPHYLTQSCTETTTGERYSCMLNLQQSYNNATILGEAAIKNMYSVFDMQNRRIGFAPARNKYNENLFYLMKEGAKKLGKQIFTDIEFIIRFVIVILLLVLALLSFRYIGCIS